MHYSLQNKPNNIFRNPWVILSLTVLLLVALGIAYAYQGIFAVYSVLFVVICTIIAVSIKALQKRSIDEFDTTDNGVVVSGKTYEWSQIKYYSWYGEKQSERIGAVGVGRFIEYDPINPYRFAKTQILELHFGMMGQVKLKIDSAQMESISSELDQHGIKHISMLRKIVGF